MPSFCSLAINGLLKAFISANLFRQNLKNSFY